MNKIINILHWIAYTYYIYLFGSAGIKKVILYEPMMRSMSSLGYNKGVTILIGVAEVVGLILLLIGFWNHKVKNIAVLFFTPIAIGAFATHIAHQEYNHFYNSLICCVLSGFLLLADKHFRITI